MHTSFTGSTRRTRQVNLSGRNNQDPWAALSGPASARSSGGLPSQTSNTVAHAHAERVKRQHERERLTASRKLQRVWRGHNERRKQKAEWRRRWDEEEAERTQQDAPIRYEDVLLSEDRVPAYQDAAVLLGQMRLMLRFQEYRRGRVRHVLDTLRLIYLGTALQHGLSTSIATPTHLDSELRSSFAKLAMVVAQHLRSSAGHSPSAAQAPIQARLLKMLALLVGLVPEEMAREAQFYLESIKVVVLEHGFQECTSQAVVALVTTPASQKHASYGAFVDVLLSEDLFSANLQVLRGFADAIDMDALSLAISGRLHQVEHGSKPPLTTKQQLWQLAHLIYMHTCRRKDTLTEMLFIEALSQLVGQCAVEIAARLDTSDTAMFNNNSASHLPNEPLPPFIREMVKTIPLQDNVRGVIHEMSKQSSQKARSDFDDAKRLANYAVALLQAFPSKAPDIRMWLYQGTVRSIEDTDMSIIQYFWKTARNTNVFKKIVANNRNVLSILREAAPESNQIGQAPISAAEVALWRDEWRLILLFFELYTFVLKLMDDDEFFALDKQRTFGSTASPTSRRGALPLDDVATMTTLLKNLAFTLYWYAADLVDTNESEEPGTLSALFGASKQESRPSTEKGKPVQQTLTGNGVSQAYLKGLATGILRMLHERDSRRPFLPKNHWLMTSQVDMAGFISAVVAEEEKRHEIGDDDDDNDEEDSQMAGSDNPVDDDSHIGTGASEVLMSQLFGIRQPHTPRTTNSRYADKLERQRMLAKKKRQIESLAPRLEILRNLPFFIPFETRVQIFREFVYRDQLRRRQGTVDPDTWRMSVAASTMGRGLDGRPRGLDIISRHHAEIHRESVFEDAYENFYELGEGLKEPIQITFIDRFGAPEAGIDGGGVTKEFLMSVTSEAFDPDNTLSMFQENSQRYLYPNPTIYDETAEFLQRNGRRPGTDPFTFSMREFLRRYEFLGRVVGKCLYEGILIDVNFAGFFLLKWALTGGTTTASNESAYRASINDVRDYDEELYQGLLKLKNYPGDVESDFALDFTVTDTLTFTDDQGKEYTKTVTKDLLPNGSKTAVTNANRLVYIDRIVRYRLMEQPRLITTAFLRGLSQIISPTWLAMFNQKELQKLVGGDSTELDIADLRRNTIYSGLYALGDDGVEHPTIQLFWKVLQNMDDMERRKVLKFVTSTPRAPLLGFGHLNPRFSIRDSGGGEGEGQEGRLPSTSTCVNLLKLPRYADEGLLRERLLYAVNSGAGFDLS